MKNTICFIILLTWMAAPTVAQEPPTLNLSDALIRVLARDDFQTVLQARSLQAESEVAAQRAWDNPELMFSAERLDQNGVDGEENYLLVSQRFALSGRSERVHAARKMEQAAELENTHRRHEVQILVKRFYFEVLHRRKRMDVLTRWDGELSTLMDIVVRREKAGEASGYDRRRLARELGEARALKAREEALHQREWASLAALLQLDVHHQLSGDLLPEPLQGEWRPAQLPSILALDAMLEAALLQEKAAGRWKLTEFTLEAGLKRASVGSETDQGYYLSARAPIPLLNRNQARRMQASARAMELRGEKAWALSRAEGKALGLQRQFGALRRAALSYETEVVGPSRELVTIAGAAYEQGEMDLLRLLDAYKSLRDAELNHADLEARTRASVIALEELGGEQ